MNKTLTFISDITIMNSDLNFFINLVEKRGLHDSCIAKINVQKLF